MVNSNKVAATATDIVTAQLEVDPLFDQGEII